jgi:hypothetical protein
MFCHITIARFACLRCRFALALFVGWLALAERRVEATDFFWIAPVSGSFTDPTNWNPSGVPGSVDHAIFDLGSAGYTVSLPASSPTVGVVQLLVDHDTITLDPHQSEFTFAAHIGNSSGDIANLTLIDGTVNARRRQRRQHRNPNGRRQPGRIMAGQAVHDRQCRHWHAAHS